LFSLTCGDSEERIQVDLLFEKKECSVDCSVDRFDVYVMRGDCLYAWRLGLSKGEQVLGDLDLDPDEEVTVQVLARCGNDSCVRCAAEAKHRPGSQATVNMAFKTVDSCAAPQRATTPCTRCMPGPDATCDGDHRVTCTSSGSSEREACAQGCLDGVCSSCTKAFFLDSDKDTFGDPVALKLACTAPAGHVEDNTDCDDQNSEVHPGQTKFFTKPTRDQGGFDYNCDQKDEREYPGTEYCILDTLSGNCDGAGWIALVPPCGQQGIFMLCVKNGAICQTDQQMQKVQACR
jgi:hypothetical protein